MISDAMASAAPSQMIGEPTAANMTTAPTMMHTLNRLLTIRSTTRDRVAPANADQAPMLVAPTGFVDSMAAARVYRLTESWASARRATMTASRRRASRDQLTSAVICGPDGYDEAVAQG